MASILVSVADGVADELNAATFSKEFCAERSYADWDIALEENDETRGKLHCDVVPVTYVSADREYRAGIAYQVPVDVVFRKLVPPTARTASGRIDPAYIDDYVEFNESVYEYFMQPKALDSYSAAALLAPAWVTAYGRVDGAT